MWGQCGAGFSRGPVVLHLMWPAPGLRAWGLYSLFLRFPGACGAGYLLSGPCDQRGGVLGRFVRDGGQDTDVRGLAEAAEVAIVAAAKELTKFLEPGGGASNEHKLNRTDLGVTS